MAGETVLCPVAELRVPKQVRPGRIRPGGKLHYTIAVVHRGPDPAESVTLGERGDLATRAALPLRTADGTCRKRRRGTAHSARSPRVSARWSACASGRPTEVGRYLNAVAGNSAMQ